MARGFDEDRGRLAWWGFGTVLGLVVAYVLYRFIGTFVFGVFLYYATRPVYRRVSYRIEQPSLAAATSLALFLLPSFLLVSYTLAIAYRELQRFADLASELLRSGDLGQYEGLLEPYLQASELVANPEMLLAGGGVAAVQRVVQASLEYLGTVVLFGLHLFVIVAIAFYLLRDDQRLVRWFTARFADDRGVLDEYLTTVDDDFNNIFFGNILNAVLTGTIGAIVFTLLNLVSPASVSIPNAALVGLLTGTASLIPVVGMKLVYVPVAAYLFAVPLMNNQPETMWFPITFAAVSFVVVDTIPDLVLRPYVSGRSLHIGALMLAYILGPLLFGWYGLFLAPMLLVLVVHFARIVMPELIAGEPLKPYAVDPTYVAGDVVNNPTTRRERNPGPAAAEDTPTAGSAADGAPADGTGGGGEPDRGEGGSRPDATGPADGSDGGDESGDGSDGTDDREEPEDGDGRESPERPSDRPGGDP